MSGLPLLAPLFLVFEAWQLAMGERYVGIKQIARGADPREMGPGEAVAFLWSAGLVALRRLGPGAPGDPPARAVRRSALAATTLAGYSIRRNCGLKWILVVLTIEGAVRIGFLFALSVTAWHRALAPAPPMAFREIRAALAQPGPRARTRGSAPSSTTASSASRRRSRGCSTRRAA